MAMDAALLDYSNKKDIIKNKSKVINAALKLVSEFFDYEQMLFSNGVAKMLLMSELSRRVSRN